MSDKSQSPGGEPGEAATATIKLDYAQYSITPVLRQDTFPKDVYAGWIEKYPDSPQVASWRAAMEHAPDGKPAPSAPALPSRADIPPELLSYPNWVCWREIPNGDKKPRKVLVNPATGYNAKSDDKRTWGSFDQAIARAKRDGLAGVGFVFTGTPFCGLDLDEIRDPVSGKIDPRAQAIIDLWRTYGEVSPSDTGAHCIGRGALASDALHQAGFIECYDTGRYFTMTGRRLEGTPFAIKNVDAAINRTQATMREIRDRLADEQRAKRQIDRLAPGRQETRAPITGGDLEAQARRALDALAPWRCDKYATWLEIGMALHDAGLPLALWDHWSQQSAKYNDAGNVELMADKWTGFQAGRGITLNTLFKYAHLDAPGWHLAGSRTGPVADLLPQPAAPADVTSYRTADYCGKPFLSADPYNQSEPRWVVWNCDEIRTCPRCARKRAAELVEIIQTAMQAGPVYATRVSAKEAHSLVQKLGKDNYRRWPLVGDEVLLFNNGGKGIAVTDENLPDLERFTALVQSLDENKRMTGHLGRTEKEKRRIAKKRGETDPNDKCVEIQTRQILSDAPKAAAIDAYHAAFEKSLDRWLRVDQINAPGVERALEIITQAYAGELERRGYKILYQPLKTMRIEIVRIRPQEMVSLYALNRAKETNGSAEIGGGGIASASRTTENARTSE